MRRAQFQIEGDGGNVLDESALDRSFEDIVFAGGSLNDYRAVRRRRSTKSSR